VLKSILECINANCRFVWRRKLLPSPLQSGWDLVILGSTAKIEFIEFVWYLFSGFLYVDLLFWSVQLLQSTLKTLWSLLRSLSCAGLCIISSALSGSGVSKAPYYIVPCIMTKHILIAGVIWWSLQWLFSPFGGIPGWISGSDGRLSYYKECRKVPTEVHEGFWSKTWG